MEFLVLRPEFKANSEIWPICLITFENRTFDLWRGNAAKINVQKECRMCVQFQVLSNLHAASLSDCKDRITKLNLLWTLNSSAGLTKQLQNKWNIVLDGVSKAFKEPIPPAFGLLQIHSE